jgi:hypothetical protein
MRQWLNYNWLWRSSGTGVVLHPIGSCCVTCGYAVAETATDPGKPGSGQACCTDAMLLMAFPLHVCQKRVSWQGLQG